MKFDYLKGAFINRRNIIALVAAYAVLNILVGSFPFIPYLDANGILGLSLVVYIGFSLQSAMDKSFRREYDAKLKVRKIRSMANDCANNAKNLRRKLSIQDQNRVSKVISEMGEIVTYFLNGDKSYISGQVVEKALKLTEMYIKIMGLYFTKNKSSNSSQISFLAKRINTNTSNLNSIRDRATIEEVKRVIEADEKMIESLKNDRQDLEILDARLQYMESTLSMLKYNIISNIETEDMLITLEKDINEAAAINSVLNDRFEEKRNERLRI